MPTREETPEWGEEEMRDGGNGEERDGGNRGRGGLITSSNITSKRRVAVIVMIVMVIIEPKKRIDINDKQRMTRNKVYIVHDYKFKTKSVASASVDTAENLNQINSANGTHNTLNSYK